MTLTDAEQEQWRARYRRHWQDRVPFNKACGMLVTRWELDGVTLELPYAAWLTNSRDTLHGGVLAAFFCDTAGHAAVVAGHDYSQGTSPSTVSMSIQYLATARQGDIVAHGLCTKRGRRIQFADVQVIDRDERLLATAHLSVIMT